LDDKTESLSPQFSLARHTNHSEIVRTSFPWEEKQASVLWTFCRRAYKSSILKEALKYGRMFPTILGSTKFLSLTTDAVANSQQCSQAIKFQRCIRMSSNFYLFFTFFFGSETCSTSQGLVKEHKNIKLLKCTILHGLF